MYEIVRYEGGRNDEIVALVLGIQQDDVGLDVPIEEQPELFDSEHAYRHGAFWLALVEGEIVGTVGMVRFGASGIVKKLLVHREHRGQSGVAHRLHDHALGWAMDQHLTEILLDTPSIARRSHAFYRTKGYQLAERAELPSGYSFPDRDSVIYKLILSGTS